ncbi:MAG TPA: transglycosylase SLT domain-containing protein [Verrucomicrobiae bacterium]|jgi:hypothetical protein
MRLTIFHALMICAAALPAFGGSVVTDAFVEAVAQIESNTGRFTVGDDGRAIGWWQMHEPAWQDTSAFRAGRHLPTWEYDQAQNPKIARLYARDYLTMMENQIRAATKEEPSAEIVYAAYNVGFGRLQSLGFNIARTRPHTKAACARLRELISSFQNPSEQATAQLATK